MSRKSFIIIGLRTEIGAMRGRAGTLSYTGDFLLT